MKINRRFRNSRISRKHDNDTYCVSAVLNYHRDTRWKILNSYREHAVRRIVEKKYAKKNAQTTLVKCIVFVRKSHRNSNHKYDSTIVVFILSTRPTDIEILIDSKQLEFTRRIGRLLVSVTWRR